MENVVVTGGSSGVGRAIAGQFARKGFRVWALGRDTEALATLRSVASVGPGAVEPVEVDLLRNEDVISAAKHIGREADGIDVLIHAAGIFVSSTMANFRTDEYEEVFGLHIRARCLLNRELLPRIRRPGGHVVFINSSVGLRSKARLGVYAASMQAGRGIADALRDEVNEHGIRVLSVFLGRTATPMQERIYRADRKEYRPDELIQPDTVASTVFHSTQLPLDAEITEIAIRPTRKSL